MRRLYLITAVALAGCIDEGEPKLQPEGRLYFPTGILHLDDESGGEGRLYVAGSNFDGRFDFGALTAIHLDELELPAFGAAPASPVPDVTEIHTRGVQGAQVQIDSFAAGKIGHFPLPGGGHRLFLPTRDENHRVMVVDAAVPGQARLVCYGQPEPPGDCIAKAPSLSLAELREEGKPRALQPAGVDVDVARGRVYIAHRDPATELGTFTDPQSYLVELDALAPTGEGAAFHPIGPGGSTAVLVAGRYAHMVGFPSFLANDPPLLRAVDLLAPERVINVPLEQNFNAIDGREVALSSDGTRMYLLGRFPDTLLVVELSNLGGSSPGYQVDRGLQLPDDPNHLVVIPRPGRGDLVAITTTQADSVVLYDEDVGNLVAQVQVGVQPFGITADLRDGGGVRLYTSVFAEGQVAVLDIPDLDRPEDIRLVAKIGERQVGL